MRRNTAALNAQHPLPLPRGWIILGAALTSWALFAAAWVGASQLFHFVLAAF
ncbi:hypothetical protein D3C86_2176110 [compost metagenome]